MKSQPTILLTGGAGVLGSHVAEMLVREGRFNVVIPLRDPAGGWRLADCHGWVGEIADLGDEGVVRRVFDTHQPDVVLHFAWQGVGPGDRQSVDQRSNLDMQNRLLDGCRRIGTRLFVGIGSQAEYGVHNRRIDETASTNPVDEYGEVKLQAGIEGLQAAASIGLNFVWLRLFSSFGPRDDDRYFIPYVITSLLAGEAPQLTACEQVWDWLYGPDVPRWIRLVIDHNDDVRGAFNMCSGMPVRMLDAVHEIERCVGGVAKAVIGARPYRPNALMHLEGDPAKFMSTFGNPGPGTPFPRAIRDTVAWYRFRKYGHEGSRESTP